MVNKLRELVDSSAYEINRKSIVSPSSLQLKINIEIKISINRPIKNQIDIYIYNTYVYIYIYGKFRLFNGLLTIAEASAASLMQVGSSPLHLNLLSHAGQ